MKRSRAVSDQHRPIGDRSVSPHLTKQATLALAHLMDVPPPSAGRPDSPGPMPPLPQPRSREEGTTSPGATAHAVVSWYTTCLNGHGRKRKRGRVLCAVGDEGGEPHVAGNWPSSVSKSPRTLAQHPVEGIQALANVAKHQEERSQEDGRSDADEDDEDDGSHERGVGVGHVEGGSDDTDPESEEEEEDFEDEDDGDGKEKNEMSEEEEDDDDDDDDE